MNALVVSEAIPFIEYDLHRQLLNKLRVHGMNAAFGLRTQVKHRLACLTKSTHVSM